MSITSKSVEKNSHRLYKTTCIIFLFLLTVTCEAQTLAGFNGWEFLPWNTDSAQVQVMVQRNRKKLQEPNGLDADFKYQDMNTWLEYANHHLFRVRQKADFNVNGDKEAREAYEKTYDRLLRLYGKPQTENKDTTAKTIHLDWDLEYTQIHLEYDYRYKVIDEFGAGSYWVELVFEEKFR